MSIEKFIKKVCVQTAVYWGNPQNDGFGNFIFDPAIEIKCRWEDKAQIVAGTDGIDTSSDAEVMVLEDLDYDGVLFLGTLNDLDSDQIANPMLVEDSRRIISDSKIPMIFSKQMTVRKVYLRKKWYVSVNK